MMNDTQYNLSRKNPFHESFFFEENTHTHTVDRNTLQAL